MQDKNKVNDGGPAFPTTPVSHGYGPETGGHGTPAGPGMSLRAHFAGIAMGNLSTACIGEESDSDEYNERVAKQICRIAVLYADSLIAELEIADIEPMAKHRKRINDKRAANRCLLCDEPIHRRGLCGSHYWSEYRLPILSTPPNRRHIAEAKLVREGKLLANNQGRGGGRKRVKKGGTNETDS